MNVSQFLLRNSPTITLAALSKDYMFGLIVLLFSPRDAIAKCDTCYSDFIYHTGALL